MLWKPAFFGVKPSMILKGGSIAWAQMGDPNASIPTPQPVHGRPMFAAYGGANHRSSLSFVSRAALRRRRAGRATACRRTSSPIGGVRELRKADMIHNGYAPSISVDPETYIVVADGQTLLCEPAKVLPMAQRYFLF